MILKSKSLKIPFFDIFNFASPYLHPFFLQEFNVNTIRGYWPPACPLTPSQKIHKKMPVPKLGCEWL